ncbi:hypothetical protein [Streptomyces avermitilis]|uniref:hypothetical protein n=1 Tax=Streptomyces avermitilis TaxID=33903 RepID=UPI003809186E
MAEVLCVVYDDPTDGHPTAYARDDLPAIDHYPGGQTTPMADDPTNRRTGRRPRLRTSAACSNLRAGATTSAGPAGSPLNWWTGGAG